MVDMVQNMSETTIIMDKIASANMKRIPNYQSFWELNVYTVNSRYNELWRDSQNVCYIGSWLNRELISLFLDNMFS